MKKILSMILMSTLLLGSLTACDGHQISEGELSMSETARPKSTDTVSAAQSETTEPSSETAKK